MQLIEIESLDDPRVADYRDVKDAELRRRSGLFVVEGRGSLEAMLAQSRYQPLSLLLTPAARDAMADALAALAEATPVFVASRACLNGIAGIDVHRGALALGRRDADETPAVLLASDAVSPAPNPSRLVVLEDVSDPDNVGQIFRNALAFGVEAVLLSPHCADPLYRKAIRTSMGASLRVPFARFEDAASWTDEAARLMRGSGHALVALDPVGEADAAALPGRVALAFGNEGHGLADALLAQADQRLRIDMVDGMDSVNVATASGIALHLFFARATRAG